MVEAKKEAPKEKKLKYKVVGVSQYYLKARELAAGNVRDTALELLYEEYGDRIVAQVPDQKAGEMKFVVKV